MQSVKQTLVSPWKGSEQTAEAVREQVRERWGDEVADEFDPATDAMPFSAWFAQGYVPRKGSRALRSITIIETKDLDDEKKTKKIVRTVCLFHKRQVQKIAP